MNVHLNNNIHVHIKPLIYLLFLTRWICYKLCILLPCTFIFCIYYLTTNKIVTTNCKSLLYVPNFLIKNYYKKFNMYVNNHTLKKFNYAIYQNM